jgi:hypothetical protein
MGIFGNIVNAIFGARTTGTAAAGATATGTATASSGSAAASGGGKPTPITREQLEEKIQQIADDTGRSEYNWDTSIVDLMKLLDLDSSLKARSELAKELGYTGALNGSAEMNIWLHKQVMEKMMASGGTVPDELK